ncbi:flagellar hook-basal body complex protein FliE [Pontivivens ytuae]|uniref:Flagellar hook-basal body complex protein FliE n=1 Tax=Pontivivens ytuae TaxID=2789856 RepID=A0A7S9LPT9_9RHOB|nr:flagellar hook-basal body complex protein FliE [Pontivivens ytuae]QPH53086.1 flagellar hook-basal body complex protein FliE [Pontivivens ytuae]
MELTSTLASRAYTDARTAAAPTGGGEPGPVARAAGSFMETLEAGESAAKGALTGGVDPHAMVEALAATELAVETAVTVRDRVVEAYNEILRMPV